MDKSAIIDIVVVASQVDAEQDSFGQDYDKCTVPIVAQTINASTNGIVVQIRQLIGLSQKVR